MTCRRGDLTLVLFPFTDLSSAKGTLDGFRQPGGSHGRGRQPGTSAIPGIGVPERDRVFALRASALRSSAAEADL